MPAPSELSPLYCHPQFECGVEEGIVGWVATHGDVLNIPDAYADARFNHDADKKTKCALVPRTNRAEPSLL